jgi:hypothetical protein
MCSAWQVREEAVVGGPAWLDSERFDEVANSPPDTPPKDLSTDASEPFDSAVSTFGSQRRKLDEGLYPHC